MTATLINTMAGRPKKTYQTETVRVPRDIGVKLRLLAAGHGLDIPDYMDQFLRHFLDRELSKLGTTLIKHRPKKDEEDSARHIERGKS